MKVCEFFIFYFFFADASEEGRRWAKASASHRTIRDLAQNWDCWITERGVCFISPYFIHVVTEMPAHVSVFVFDFRRRFLIPVYIFVCLHSSEMSRVVTNLISNVRSCHTATVGKVVVTVYLLQLTSIN